MQTYGLGQKLLKEGKKKQTVASGEGQTKTTWQGVIELMEGGICLETESRR